MPSVKFYLEKPYLPKTDKKLKTSECSIYLMFTVDKQRRFPLTLDERIQPKHWDFKGQQVKSTYRGHHEVNIYLSDIKTKLLTLYRENREIPFSKFKALAQQKPSQEKKTLFLAYEQFLNQYKAEKDSKTVAKFDTLKKHLIKFDSIHSFDFDTLDFKFFDAFKAYLYSIPNQFYLKYRLVNRGDYWEMEEGSDGLPVGIFDDQVFAYIRQFKTFLKWAERREHKIHPSFKNWRTTKLTHDPITLTFDELHKLEACNYTSKAIDIARDYLVMECRTGQRISDVKRLQIKDFSITEYTFKPRKGHRLHNKSVTIYFDGYCANALTILAKHNGQMPVVSEQKINQNIKKACKEAGIDSEFIQYRWAANKRVRFIGPKYEFISSHVGRKTCVTLMLQTGIPLDVVMEFVGITDEKTIKFYRGKFEGKKMREYLQGVESKNLMKKAI
jgi:integrase